MRLSIASTSVAALLVLSVVVPQVAGQRLGGAGNGNGNGAEADSGSGSDDPVTYTSGGVVYTALIDADGDTVSNVAVSTVAAAATTAAAVGAGANAGGVSNAAAINDNKDVIKDIFDVIVNKQQQQHSQDPSQLLQFQKFERRSFNRLDPDQPKLDKRQVRKRHKEREKESSGMRKDVYVEKRTELEQG